MFAVGLLTMLPAPAIAQTQPRDDGSGEHEEVIASFHSTDSGWVLEAQVPPELAYEATFAKGDTSTTSDDPWLRWNAAATATGAPFVSEHNASKGHVDH